jgi:S-adenosylmethionine-diacylglycerol 3-amino-3-carboxypropyl transferase
VGPDDDVLSVCSAGDNSFALAAAGARSVTAVDLSLPQIALAELKLVAARELPIQSVRSLLGLGHFGRRVWFYHYLRPKLTDPTRAFWDANEGVVRAGIMGSGRFERYLASFRDYALPMLQRREVVERMLACRSIEEQRQIFDTQWDGWRWRAAVRLFTSRPVMARFGRSEEQFAQVAGGVGDAFLDRARHVLTEVPIADNWFVRWILTGSLGDLERAHPWLTTEGHRALRTRTDAVRLVHTSLEDLLERCAPGSFSAFNYSNVFEYVSPSHAARLLELTVRAARPGARIVYWNLLVDRWRPDRLADRLTRDTALAERLTRNDRAMFYKAVQVERVR